MIGNNLELELFRVDKFHLLLHRFDKIPKRTNLGQSDNMGNAAAIIDEWFYFVSDFQRDCKSQCLYRAHLEEPYTEERIVQNVEDFVVDDKGNIITLSQEGVLVNLKTKKENTLTKDEMESFGHLKRGCGLTVAVVYNSHKDTNRIVLVDEKRLKEVCSIILHITGSLSDNPGCIVRTIVFTRPMKSRSSLVQLWVLDKNSRVNICLSNGRTLACASGEMGVEINIAGSRHF